MATLKDHIRRTPLHRILRLIKGYFILAIEILAPKARPWASWLYKIRTIRQYAKKYGIQTFVETGTNVGETLNGVKSAFKRSYSVELSDELYKRASQRFAHDPSVTIHHGDSFAFLKELTPRLQEPAVYWLDAHYSAADTARGSKDTPIVEELNVCFANWRTGSIILIDDGCRFNGEDGYPTFDEIRETARKHNPRMQCVLEHDIIRIWESDLATV